VKKLPYLFVVLLLAFFAVPSVCFAEVEDDAAMREEALKTIMYRWSQTAKTSELSYSDEEKQAIDLWLDFCRNKYGRRALKSDKFMGVPHEMLVVEDGKITFAAMFVMLEIAKSVVPVSRITNIVKFPVLDEVIEKVKVDGDENSQLRMWLFMYASMMYKTTTDYMQTDNYRRFLENGGEKVIEDDLNLAAREVVEYLEKNIESTAKQAVKYPMPGVMEGERSTWLKAIASIGGLGAAKILKRLVSVYREDGSLFDASEASRALMSLACDAAYNFMIEELDSGDEERVNTALGSVRKHCPLSVAEKILSLLDNGEIKDTMGVSALEMMMSPDSPDPEKVKAALIERFEKYEETDTRFTIACALLRKGYIEDAFIAKVKEIIAVLEAKNPGDGRISYIKGLLQQYGK